MPFLCLEGISKYLSIKTNGLSRPSGKHTQEGTSIFVAVNPLYRRPEWILGSRAFLQWISRVVKTSTAVEVERQAGE